MLPLRKLLVIVALLVGATASVVHFTPGERAHVAIDTPMTRDTRVVIAAPPAVFPDLGPLVNLADTIRTETYLAELDAYLASVAPPPIPAAVPERARAAALPETQTAGGGGSITDDQFVALARCESGTVDDGTNTGGWRTGLYGIEGDGAGSLSPAEQRAWAQQIYNDHGASAWGVACRGILGG